MCIALQPWLQMIPDEGGFCFYWTTSFILEGVLLEYHIRNVQLLFFTVKCFSMIIIMNLYEGNGKKIQLIQEWLVITT